MSKASIGLVVRLVVTKRWPDGTTSSTAHVTAIDSRGVMFHEIALGDQVELARALEEAKWRADSIRVPATFFAQNEAAKIALLHAAMRSSSTRVHA